MPASKINGVLTGSVQEDGAVTFSGALKISDEAAGLNLFGPTDRLAGLYGSLTLASNGVWKYTLDNDSAMVQALPKGQTASDEFIVSWNYQEFASISVSVAGRNDAATISGELALALPAASQSRVAGTLAVSDIDAGEKAFKAATLVAGTYGSLSISSSGAIVYTLDAGWRSVPALAAGQLVHDVITVQTLDGTQASVKIAIQGSTASTALNGGAGNDRLLATDGDNRIDGAAGTDTVVYEGVRSAYNIVAGSNGHVVTDRIGAGGNDTLQHVERLLFSDGAVALDVSGVGGQVYRIYQAAFNRAPDLAGLGYWMRQMDDGASLGTVAEGFVGSGEFSTLYGANPTNGQLVDRFYQNVLHRAGDAGGLAYWTNLLDQHLASPAAVLAGFSESPENQQALALVIGNGFSYQPFG